ncbi:hypothetical protein Aduo_007348 [Ancylostoma duodenale]
MMHENSWPFVNAENGTRPIKKYLIEDQFTSYVPRNAEAVKGFMNRNQAMRNDVSGSDNSMRISAALIRLSTRFVSKFST